MAALALAGCAALALGAAEVVGFTSESAEQLFTALWVLGWVLLAWAVVIGGTCVVQLVRRLVRRRGTAWPEALLLVAGAAVVVAVVRAHPLWGSGSGAG
ncbi:hypothetical protein [Kineococcus auxinigenes]|uniref:hypothetical protein n=1 Tax=unclassified Kineococcus TaxID=2621656 RepID=UPI003D7C5560